MSRSGSRRRALAFGLAFPLLLLFAAELVLRVTASAPPSSLQLVETETGRWWTREPNLAALQQEQPPRADRIAAAEPRDPEVFRIVVLGESTAAGFPLYPYFSFGRVLEELLGDAVDGREFEVINLGKAADSSAAVLDVARGLGPVQPDLVVVYTGHNDYQVPYCEELREDGGWVRALAQLHLVRALAGASSGPRATAPRPPSGRLIGDDEFLTPAEKQRGVERFERNLRGIVEATRDFGVPCVLMTQAANLRSFAPSYSVFTAPLDAERRGDYEDLLRRTQDDLAAGNAVDPARIQGLLDQDGGVALTWFLLGQAHERRDQRDLARDAFHDALSWDQYPNRAGDHFNAVICAVAAEGGATLVEVEAAMEAWSTGAVPGADLFFDHCHPDVDATARVGGLLFRTVIDLLVQEGVLERDEVEVPAEMDTTRIDGVLARMGLDRGFLATRSLGAARLNLLAYLDSPTSTGPLNLAANAYGIALQVDENQFEALSGMTVVSILRRDRDAALRYARHAVQQNAEALVALAALASGAPTLQQALNDLDLHFESGQLRARSP